MVINRLSSIRIKRRVRNSERSDELRTLRFVFVSLRRLAIKQNVRVNMENEIDLHNLRKIMNAIVDHIVDDLGVDIVTIHSSSLLVEKHCSL